MYLSSRCKLSDCVKVSGARKKRSHDKPDKPMTQNIYKV